MNTKQTFILTLLLPLLLLAQAQAGDPGKLYFRWHYFLTNAGRNKPVLSDAPDLYDVGPRCWANVGFGYEKKIWSIFSYHSLIFFHPYYATLSPVGVGINLIDDEKTISFNVILRLTVSVTANDPQEFNYSFKTYTRPATLSEKGLSYAPYFYGGTFGGECSFKTKIGTFRVGMEIICGQSLIKSYAGERKSGGLKYLFNRGYKNNPYNDGFTQQFIQLGPPHYYWSKFVLEKQYFVQGMCISLAYIFSLSKKSDI